MPTWVMWLAVALVVVAVVSRHLRRSRAETLLDEHARRRTGGAPTPVSVWREANRLFRAGEREGLLLLAAIGRELPRRRQDVVDTWLAALRGGVSRGLDSPWRTAVQRELVSHLRPGDDFWPGMDVPAAGAILVDVDLSGCRVGRVDFTGAVFVGDARFSAMTVTGEASFDGARFLRHAVFTDALFARSVSSLSAVFTGNLAFSGVQVAGEARLRAAKVSGRADLRRAEFGGPADFAEVFFGGRALFGEVVFHHDAVFSRAWFRGRTDVGSALIGEAAEFDGVRFGRRVMR
ncbi:pentapeptide repeat-containing protein [Actinosynnema sp. CS-041913]|uniref:pentapeptide repeat-containing protein n=1 Tax=Actinosynnema sp. CS-041913 TaxID=3239917 RepID=UPI003D8E5D7D